MSTGLKKIIKNKPHLVWYVQDIKNLSEASIFEHILNFGEWKDVQETIQILG